jgi:tRNA(Ile)-lysidine synthase
LRHQVLPALAQATGRDLTAAIGRSRQLLQEDAEALDAWANQAWEPLKDLRQMPAQALEPLPRALQRRLLERWLSEQSGFRPCAPNVLEAALEALECAQAQVKPFNWATPGGHLYWKNRAFSWQASSPQTEMICPDWGVYRLIIPGQLALTSFGVLKATLISLEPSLQRGWAPPKSDPKRQVCLDAQALAGGPLQVRQWHPGDRYRPLGSPGTRKLQDCFTDRRVPTVERHRLPVVINWAGEVLWVPGLLPSHTYRLVSGTQSALQLTFSTSLPTFDLYA